MSQQLQRPVRTVLPLALSLVLLPSLRAEERRADVVIYGGTASGAIAAVAAAREGRTVILVEPGKHIGGMVSGGLGATDTGKRPAIGGYSREFFTRVHDYYVKKYGADSAQVKDCSDGFRFEPHVAEQVFREMLKQAKVAIYFDQVLDQVKKTGTRIQSFSTREGDAFVATVFIDTTYEGDLMAKARVKYAIGREGREQYNESIAGVQKRSPAHQWSVAVSPFGVGDRLLPFVQAGPAGEPGAGDRKVQAYNFRLCMTKDKSNLMPWPKPAGYDPAQYELLARCLAKKPGLTMRNLMNPVPVPNNKTDTNNNGALSTDFIGMSWDYPEGDAKTRARIWREHVEYTQGFLYFLANDPRSPEALRKEMNSWGLAKDEFKDSDNWPHQLYVREARRMIGEFVMTQADIMSQRSKSDSVGLGSYNTDSHHVQRVPTKDGAVINEGDFQVGVQPYAVAYPSLVPKANECENLLVPVCCSASHVAYCTIRMEPVYMILGQASGVAASLAIDGKTSVQKVPTAQLTAKLKAQKSVLSPDDVKSAPSNASARSIEAGRLAGIVVDDEQATQTGFWSRSRSTGQFVGDGYLHDGNEEKGKKQVRFTPKILAKGRYEVFLHYAANGNRATNVPIVVHFAEGEKIVTVNQRKTTETGKGLRLGTFDFEAGEKGWVEVRTDRTDGYVIADAVQFVPVK